MLRHFVIPASQLQEFATLSDAWADSPSPWSLSVLGPRCETVVAWDAACHKYLAEIQTFVRQYGDRVQVAALEFSLPVEIATSPVELATSSVQPNALESLLQNTLQQVDAAQLNVSHVFIEIPSGSNAVAARQFLAEQLGHMSQKTTAYGLKLRTGGLEAAAFPSIDELAEVIHLCEKANVAWKATAGLHHPMPHTSPDIGVTMHGFLNLLIATTLAQVHHLNVETIREILTQPDASQFILCGDVLCWRDFSASLSQIKEARRHFVSFGSCSFNEPQTGLAAIFAGTHLSL